MVLECERAREKTQEERFEETKEPPIKVKWFDCNKRDRQHMNVRSKLVAKQINTNKKQGFFAVWEKSHPYRSWRVKTCRTRRRLAHAKTRAGEA